MLGFGFGLQLSPMNSLPATVPLPAGPLLGAAMGDVGLTEVTAYEGWLGRNLDMVNLFAGRDTWSNVVGSIGYEATLYAGVNRMRYWTLPLTLASTAGTDAGKIAENNSFLDQAAAGDFNSHYHDMAVAVLANAYPTTGPVIIRMGHEFNLSPLQQPWSIWGGKHTQFIAAWRNFVNEFRKVSNRFKFVWCPNFEKFSDTLLGYDGLLVDPELAYPGAAYVDVHGMDFYTNGFSADPTGAYNYYFGGNAVTGRRLNWHVAFAAANGRPWGIDEWGINQDGFESFVSGAKAFYDANGALYTMYWENTSAYNAKQSTEQYPTTGDQYCASFGLPHYLGQAATRCHLSRSFTATPKQMMLRTYHTAQTDITALRIAEANWRVDGSTFAETGSGANFIVTAAIEYPLNVCTRLLWGGNTSKTIATATTELSDYLAINIPRGAMFAVRRYITCTAGIPFGVFNDTSDRGFGADIMGYAASGITDQTMSNATVTTAQGPGTMHYPAAILAKTRRPSLAVVGDSRNVGTLTTSSTASFDSVGNLGEIQRTIGATNGCLDLGLYGEKMQNFVGSHALRVALGAYCSHICIQMGANDYNGGRTTTQMANDSDAIAGYFTGKTIIYSTIAPISTSSDSWATVANQTVNANNANRNTENTRRKAKPICWDVASVVEDTVNGKWKAPGYTGDGVHESASAYAAIVTAGVVRAADMVWP